MLLLRLDDDYCYYAPDADPALVPPAAAVWELGLRVLFLLFKLLLLHGSCAAQSMEVLDSSALALPMRKSAVDACFPACVLESFESAVRQKKSHTTQPRGGTTKP